MSSFGVAQSTSDIEDSTGQCRGLLENETPAFSSKYLE